MNLLDLINQYIELTFLSEGNEDVIKKQKEIYEKTVASLEPDKLQEEITNLEQAFDLKQKDLKNLEIRLKMAEDRGRECLHAEKFQEAQKYQEYAISYFSKSFKLKYVLDFYSSFLYNLKSQIKKDSNRSL